MQGHFSYVRVEGLHQTFFLFFYLRVSPVGIAKYEVVVLLDWYTDASDFWNADYVIFFVFPGVL